MLFVLMPLANIHHFLIVPLILSFSAHCLTALFYASPCPIISYWTVLFYLCIIYLCPLFSEHNEEVE